MSPANVDRIERQSSVADSAASLWQSSPAAGEHAYLSAHGIPAHGLRQRGGRLVVPMRDAAGELWNLQFIGPGGGRPKYLHGGRVFGLLHLIGTPGDEIHVAEDYASATRIHADTGDACAVAFELHNLRPAALALREAYPGARFTVWLPEPPQSARGVSLGHRGALTAATAAATAVGGAVAILRGEKQ
jgi:putative DNA primase/helicase